EAERAIIVDDVLARRHDRQLRSRLIVREADAGPVEQRHGLGGGFPIERTDLPESGAAVEADRAEGVGLGELFDLVDVEAGAQPDVAHGFVAVAAPGDEHFHTVLRQALYLTEAEADGVIGPDDAAHFGMAVEDTAGVELVLLQRAVPGGKIDVGP